MDTWLGLRCRSCSVWESCSSKLILQFLFSRVAEASRMCSPVCVGTASHCPPGSVLIYAVIRTGPVPSPSPFLPPSLRVSACLKGISEVWEARDWRPFVPITAQLCEMPWDCVLPLDATWCPNAAARQVCGPLADMGSTVSGNVVDSCAGAHRPPLPRGRSRPPRGPRNSAA